MDGPGTETARAPSRLAGGALRSANALLASATRAAWPGRAPGEPAVVTLWRTGNVGDVVCALPVLAAARVRWPEARLRLVTSPGDPGSPGARELLADAPWIDDLVVYHPRETAWRELARALRGGGTDVLLRLPQNLTTPRRELRDLLFLRSAVRPRWARGFALGSLRFVSRAAGARLARGRVLEHESVRLLRLLEEPLGPVRRPEFPLPIEGDPSERAARLLVERGLAESDLLVLAPGAKRTTNRWPAERFGAVASRWTLTGGAAAVIGGPGDRELCREVARAAGPGTVDLCGSSPLLVSAALLRRAALLVSNDSGCMHLAAAVGTPCVVPFSARDAAGRWHPHGWERGAHEVLRRSPACSPCWLERCPHDRACLTDIEVGEVWEAVERAAGRSGGRAGLATAI